MEIYNEIIKDLLAPENNNLKIHEHLERGVYVGDLKEEIVTSPQHVLQIMEMGEPHRHVGATGMNDESSRSHTIFRVVIESRERSANQERASIATTQVILQSSKRLYILYRQRLIHQLIQTLQYNLV
jgi:centromeric protein E